MSAVKPVLLGRSTLTPRSSSSLTISRWPPATAACSRALRPLTGQSASTRPPSRCSHFTTGCSSPRSAEVKISKGRSSPGLSAGSSASSWAAGAGSTVVGPLTSAADHCRATRLNSSTSWALGGVHEQQGVQDRAPQHLHEHLAGSGGARHVFAKSPRCKFSLGC
eukprot:scaffold54683_cov56-Phaeocystis_antarctica.AAC.4